MEEFAGIHYQTGEWISLKTEDGYIIEKQNKVMKETDEALYIAPGLIDLQINGFSGLDFNTLPMDEEVVTKITKMLWKEGVTTYLPTIITNSDEAISSVLESIANACEKDEKMDRCIAGIHLEGPFISPEDGPRGAHATEYVKRPDWALFQKWQEISKNRIKIITLSPEWENSLEFIRKCKEKNVVVSIGHTAATSEQIHEAVAAGAKMSTHIGNGAHLMLPRHPNYIWEQLAEDDLWTCMIADGFHLPDSVLKVIMRVKREQAMLVSDAVYFSGMEPGVYSTHIGGKVVLTTEGKLHLAENPQLLAGSVQMLKWGIEHLVKKQLCSLPQAWEMASTRPGQFLNLPQKDGLAVGAPADFILFTKTSSRIEIERTIKHGEVVYENHSSVSGN